MEMFEQWANLSLMTKVTLGIGYFGVGFLVWYLHTGLECYLNGGFIGRDRNSVLKYFWEEMQWFLPGGLAKRTAYIRDMVKPRANINGTIGGYWYAQIRDQNLYEVVAKTALGNGYRFWGANVIMAFFLWPVGLSALILIIIINNAVHAACSAFGALRKTQFYRR